MKISRALNSYLAKHYVMNLIFMIAILWGVIYLFDTVELLRRAGKRDDVPLSLVLQMGILKLPEVGTMVFPFAVLFSAMFSFWQLTRRHELVIVRSAGFSVWQFLAPVVGVALILGVLTVTVVNPIGAMFLSKFEGLEGDYLSHRTSFVSLLDEGLWLRQSQEEGYVILHAEGIKMPDWDLQNVMALYFDDANNPVKRVDADIVSLDNGMWLFKKAQINQGSDPVVSVPLVALPTDLTAYEIEESFASPETMSFWRLPAFIKTMEATGFDATRLKIHFQSLLAQPLLFMAMILLAASVSMRPPRQRGTFILIVTGVAIGFISFFMSSFLQALGASQQIPVILAAWSPAVILLLLGTAAMLGLEDG